MRPKHKTYTPAAVDTDGIVDGATGATSPIAQVGTSAGDGLAHQLNLTSAANLSGITFTITGTDADGLALTESIAGPNATTIETTEYFRTVTSIAISATLGANTVDIGWVDEFVTPTLPMAYTVDRAQVSVKVTGTINYSVQQTLSDLRAITAGSELYWTDIVDPAGLIDLTSITAAVDWTFQPPPRAIRLKANSYSSGAVLDLYNLHQWELS